MVMAYVKDPNGRYNTSQLAGKPENDQCAVCEETKPTRTLNPFAIVLCKECKRKYTNSPA
jgi:hypothetical protein